MKIRKIVGTLLALGFILAALWVAGLIVERSDRKTVLQATAIITRSTGTESVTTYDFPFGTLTGRVSALGVGADSDRRGSLQAHFKGVLANGLDRAFQFRDMEAVTREGKRLGQFDFSFEKAGIKPGQEHAFAGAAIVDADFFNNIVRKYDLALRIQTDIGAFELPLIVYTLEVEAALAAGLLKTNHVSIGEAAGIIHFLNCEQANAAEVCDPVLKQMGLSGF